MQVVKHLGRGEPRGSRDVRERVAEGADPLTVALDLVLPACRAARSTAVREEGRRKPRLRLSRKIVTQINPALRQPVTIVAKRRSPLRVEHCCRALGNPRSGYPGAGRR